MIRPQRFGFAFRKPAEAPRQATSDMHLDEVPFPLLVLVVVCVFLGLLYRFLGMPDAMNFFGDQGMDLTAALRIIRGVQYPLVGPLLGVPGLNSPPTYYYFLAVVLALVRTETGVLFVFAAMNIAAGILFAVALKRRTDTATALIFFAFYMTAQYSVTQARMIWQPFPLTFFLAVGCWLLSFRGTRTYPRLIAASICFAVGVTCYLGGVLLIPWLMFKAASYLEPRLKSTVAAWMVGGGTVLAAIALLCLPWIIHEYRNAFPTGQAIAAAPAETAPAAIELQNSILGYAANGLSHAKSVTRLAIPVFLFSYSAAWMKSAGYAAAATTLLWLVLLLAATGRFSEYRRFLGATGWPFLIAGQVAAVAFQSDIPQSYRFIGFLPPILSAFAYLLRSVTFLRRGWMAASVGIAVFLVLNFPADILASSMSRDGIMSYRDVERLYRYVTGRAADTGIPITATDIHLITETDPYDYEAQALWYLLYKRHGYDLPVTPDGNDTRRDVIIRNGASAVYLICFPTRFPSELCWNTLQKPNPAARITGTTLMPPYTVIDVAAAR